MKFGVKAFKTDSRTLKLRDYLEPSTPPLACDWSKGVSDFGAMLNDALGDCTIAGCGHAIQIWSLNSVGLELTVPDSDIQSAYEAWCGYNPADPSTDGGGIELDVLTDWKKNGLAGHALLGFADPNVANIEEVKQVIATFGGVYIGMQVPNSAMANANDPTVVWDVAADDGGIDGDHCVFVMGYADGVFKFISWGKIYTMTVAFWAKYVQEAHALLSSTWINSATGAPSGLNLNQLTADLAAIN